MQRCKGDTRGDGFCNQDPTHRVCADIAKSDTFWKATNQKNWCNGTRCNPNWCICKWAFNDWVKHAGCDNVSFDCDSTDIQNVLNSRTDGGRSLTHVRECIRKRCGNVP